MKYDPDIAPDAKAWLELDEQERIALVRACHRRHKIRLPSAMLHAVIHVTVENQLALAEPAVVETLDRLRTEGLSRHDAVHAIGSVLATHMYDLMQTPPRQTADASNEVYFTQLRRLTAEQWLHQA